LQAQYVPEIDVIIAIAKWLYANGWTMESFSIPSGQKIDSVNSKTKLRTELAKLGIEDKSIRFLPKGEDIRARERNNLWRIECKSLGTGKRSTDRNNFDRAVASCVSYYTQREGLRLGLALPEEYRDLIRDRLPQALREAINLWVFIYVSSDDFVAVFAPDEEIPS